MRLDRSHDEIIPTNPEFTADLCQFIAEYGLLFVRPPAIVPMMGGRVQLEWHHGDRSLEIEFSERGHVHYLKWDSSRDITEEEIVSIQDRPVITGLLTWFFSEN